MLKFGREFQKEFKHYVILRKRQEKKLREGFKILDIPDDRTKFDSYVLSSIDFLLDINHVVMHCFKSGFIFSGLHHVRLMQEIVHKLWAIYLEPNLIDQDKISPGKVREILKENGFAHWREFYNKLSEISHWNRNIATEKYPIFKSRNVRHIDEQKIIIEYYLMILNHFNHKALHVLYKQLKRHVGGDYRKLVKNYNDFEEIVENDWNIVTQKLDDFKNEMDEKF